MRAAYLDGGQTGPSSILIVERCIALTEMHPCGTMVKQVSSTWSKEDHPMHAEFLVRQQHLPIGLCLLVTA
jgi:hypothetical protein